MDNPSAKLPIGIFDSGIGGISVLAEIIKILPNEEFIYFADTLPAPYGDKPEDVVREFSSVNKEDISAIVLGCTHFVLIKEEIVKIGGRKINVIDGNYGIARHLRRTLQNERLLNNVIMEKHKIPLKTNIRFYISGNGKEVIRRCKQLLQNEGIVCESEFSHCG